MMAEHDYTTACDLAERIVDELARPAPDYGSTARLAGDLREACERLAEHELQKREGLATSE